MAFKVHKDATLASKVLNQFSRLIGDSFYKLLRERFTFSLETTLEFYLGKNIKQDLSPPQELRSLGRRRTLTRCLRGLKIM